MKNSIELLRAIIEMKQHEIHRLQDDEIDELEQQIEDLGE